MKSSIDLITSTTVSAHDIEDGLEILGLGTTAEASFRIEQIVARILNVSSVTDAVYPYPEVFRHVLTDVSLRHEVLFYCAPSIVVH